MSEVAKTIITPIENLAEAVQMSVLNGQAQASFAGRATTDPTGGGAAATHCLSSGFMDETVVAVFEADPRFFVSDKVGRSWRVALTEHSPTLYEWVGL